MESAVQKDWGAVNSLTERGATTHIIVHHSDGGQNQDTDEINAEHIDIGDSEIAYTIVIKGDGTKVQGRPDDMLCAAALGMNYCSVNICVEGDFQSTESAETPTGAQIASLKECMSYYLAKYSLGNDSIIGHCDVATLTNNPDNATACPGDTLYNMLPAIIAKL
jgi:hypothetical protein